MTLEMKLRARFRTVNVRRKLRDVGVHLQNALLGPKKFDKHCIVCLDPFANETMPWRKEKIFRNLLGDRAGASHGPLRVPIMCLDSLLYFDLIEAVMQEKALVLTGNDRRK